jgi:hypothetical protein
MPRTNSMSPKTIAVIAGFAMLKHHISAAA